MKPKVTVPKVTVSEQYGHYRFYELTRQEEELHSRKNRDYAQGGDPLGNFRRVSSILSLYPGLPLDQPAVISVIYSLKQIDAVLWSMAQGYKPAVDSRGERLGDASIYMKLSRILDEETD
jgi:hypothetical protein